jgi:hypothetical protein
MDGLPSLIYRIVEFILSGSPLGEAFTHGGQNLVEGQRVGVDEGLDVRRRSLAQFTGLFRGGLEMSFIERDCRAHINHLNKNSLPDFSMTVPLPSRLSFGPPGGGKWSKTFENLPIWWMSPFQLCHLFSFRASRALSLGPCVAVNGHLLPSADFNE